jgi:hypothetical protein
MCTMPSKKTMALWSETGVSGHCLPIELQANLQLTNRFVGRFYGFHAMSAEIMCGVLHAKFSLAQRLERIPDFWVRLRHRGRGSRRGRFRAGRSMSRDRGRKDERNGYHT